jgi:hypothetical protein
MYNGRLSPFVIYLSGRSLVRVFFQGNGQVGNWPLRVVCSDYKTGLKRVIRFAAVNGYLIGSVLRKDGNYHGATDVHQEWCLLGCYAVLQLVLFLVHRFLSPW